MKKRIVLSLFLIYFSINIYSQYLLSPISASNQGDHRISLSFKLRMPPGNFNLGLAYRKQGETKWTEGNIILNQNFSTWEDRDVKLEGISIVGNSGDYQFYIAFKNTVYGNWTLVKGDPMVFPYTINLNFTSPIDEVNKILGDIETGLNTLDYVYSGIGYIFGIYFDIESEIKKIKDVNEQIGKAKSILSYVNTLNNIIKEKDDVKQYFLVMKALTKNGLPKPFNKIVSGYADVAEAMISAIDRIMISYGPQYFNANPSAYIVSFKIRKSSWGLDTYYKCSEFSTYVKSYTLLVYNNETYRTSIQLSPSEFTNEEINLNLDVAENLESGLKYFLKIEFQNTYNKSLREIIIPLNEDFSYKTIGSYIVKTRIDIRGNTGSNVFNSNFKAKIFKPGILDT